MTDDPTVDPGLRSWVPVPEGSDFPIQNLPFGVFSRGGPRRIGVAIGDHVLDVTELGRAGLLDGIVGARWEVFASDSLNPFLALGRSAWRGSRERLSALLAEDDRRVRDEAGLPERALVPMGESELHLPFEVGDYVDFYSSLEHATNLGRMFRPDAEPLLPNWRHLPVGYHGRSGTVVVSGTPVRRPSGQTNRDDANPTPVFAPTRMLDVEVELGFVTGLGNRLGEPIPIDRAADHIFGLVLVNDWSARDIQRWEYQPLGPFLGKSFATSISPWVITLDALAPYRVPGPTQEPAPLPHLRTEEDWGLDIALELSLAPDGGEEREVSRPSARHLYWTIAQQLAHATSNGATARPGDLFASGTISGPEPGSYGSLIELTWKGERPIDLSDGSSRTFLEDGDTAMIRAWCERKGAARIGFGEVRGTVLPAG